jgi:hypothetical protein
MIIVALGLVAAFYSSQLYNRYYGPFETDLSQIAQINDIDEYKKFHVRFEQQGEANPGLQDNPLYAEIMDAIRGATGQYLHFIKADDKFLMVQASVEEPYQPGMITGTLYRMGAEEELYFTLQGDKNNTIQLLPFVLNTTGALESNISALVSMSTPFLVIFVINMLRYLFRRLAPSRHPIYRKLRKFGEVDHVAAEMNEEMPGALALHKIYRVSEHWITREDTFTLKVARNHGKDTNVLEMTFKH